MSEASADNVGLVVASFGNRGQLDNGDGTRRRYVLKGRKLRTVCGDRVRWSEQHQGNELLVTEVLARDNLLERPDSRGKREPIAANLSQLVVVLAPEPEPDFFIADRYLCAAEMMRADAIIVWNKTDLRPHLPEELTNYRDLGYTVMETSAGENTGIQELAGLLANGIAMLAGQSGVGKSSLINRLVPDADVAIGELSASSGEGKHKTTASVMHTLPNNGRLIDTPGVREFAPVVSDPVRVQTGFREILHLAPGCRFSDCQHLREPDCAVKAAVKAGSVSEQRYESYTRLRHHAEGLNQLQVRKINKD
jgi:ribosome biogenesis GTPase / thiamine phosphate phosphatase